MLLGTPLGKTHWELEEHHWEHGETQKKLKNSMHASPPIVKVQV
jgi:hypothetical protein